MKKVLFVIFLLTLSACGENGADGIAGPLGAKGCDIDEKWDKELNFCIKNKNYVPPVDFTFEDILKQVDEEFCKNLQAERGLNHPQEAIFDYLTNGSTLGPNVFLSCKRFDFS